MLGPVSQSSVSVACPAWEDQACVSQLMGKLLLKSRPGVSADEGVAENECPHHAFRTLQRQIEPRHRDGKNEEGQSMKETGRACAVRMVLEKNVFFALSKGRATPFPCTLVPSMDEQELQMAVWKCVFSLALALMCPSRNIFQVTFHTCMGQLTWGRRHGRIVAAFHRAGAMCWRPTSFSSEKEVLAGWAITPTKAGFSLTHRLRWGPADSLRAEIWSGSAQGSFMANSTGKKKSLSLVLWWFGIAAWQEHEPGHWAPPAGCCSSQKIFSSFPFSPMGFCWRKAAKWKSRKCKPGFNSDVCLLHDCVIFPELLLCCAAALHIYPWDQTETPVDVIKIWSPTL